MMEIGRPYPYAKSKTPSELELSKQKKKIFPHPQAIFTQNNRNLCLYNNQYQKRHKFFISRKLSCIKLLRQKAKNLQQYTDSKIEN